MPRPYQVPRPRHPPHPRHPSGTTAKTQRARPSFSVPKYPTGEAIGRPDRWRRGCETPAPAARPAANRPLIFPPASCKTAAKGHRGRGQPMTRIDATFARLRAEGKKAFVSYIMGGDPDAATSLAVMQGLPAAGVDIIELGLPFTDPMADGPTIQLAGQRALDKGMTMDDVLDMARAFRKGDDSTPIVLMGYYNPIYSRGVDRFLADAKEAGIDGLIVVDLPPEEDDELCIPAQKAGLNFIRLATPTTDAKRLPKVLQNTSGFVYYVSITGITGAAAAQATDVGPEVARIKAATDLPVIVGFGINTPESARAIASVADGCVVGSAIVKDIGAGKPVAEVLGHTCILNTGLREQCYGVFEGMRSPDIQAQYPEAWQRWLAFDADVAVEGAETTRAFHDRVIAALQELAQQYAGEHVVVVTHGGVLDMVWRHAQALSLSGPRVCDIPNAGLNQVAWRDGGLHIQLWADAAHLADLPEQPVYSQKRLLEARGQTHGEALETHASGVA